MVSKITANHQKHTKNYSSPPKKSIQDDKSSTINVPTNTSAGEVFGTGRCFCTEATGGDKIRHWLPYTLEFLSFITLTGRGMLL